MGHVLYVVTLLSLDIQISVFDLGTLVLLVKFWNLSTCRILSRNYHNIWL